MVSDIPFPHLRLQQFNPDLPRFPDHIASAQAAADFMKRLPNSYLSRPHWDLAVARFNALGLGGDFKEFRRAIIAALKTEGWLAKELKTEDELSELLMQAARRCTECGYVTGIAISRPTDRPWDYSITRDGAQSSEACMLAIRTAYQEAVQLYDLVD